MKLIGSVVRPVSVFRPGFFTIISLGTLFLGHSALARPHKLRVSDPSEVAGLKAGGARVLADYGSFQILETDETFPALAKAGRAESADESDFIELNARPLDTRGTEIMALRKTIAPFAGKRLHLVQFVGPIKPEWRHAIEQLGVTVVHYIPQNAYLVHGDNAALARLQAWGAASDFVQWEGSYADDYKIHPRARTVDAKGNSLKPATDTFAVQLLDDADDNPATLALIEQLKLEPVKQQFRTLNYLNVIVRLPPEKLAEPAHFRRDQQRDD